LGPPAQPGGTDDVVAPPVVSTTFAPPRLPALLPHTFFPIKILMHLGQLLNFDITCSKWQVFGGGFVRVRGQRIEHCNGLSGVAGLASK